MQHRVFPEVVVLLNSNIKVTKMANIGEALRLC